MVLHKLTDLEWVQTTWADFEPLLNLGFQCDYQFTNARVVFGPLIFEFVLAFSFFVIGTLFNDTGLSRNFFWIQLLKEHY